MYELWQGCTREVWLLESRIFGVEMAAMLQRLGIGFMSEASGYVCMHHLHATI